MQWIESRLHALERRVEDLYRRLLDLINQLNGVRQGLANAFAATAPDSGSGGSGGYYGCITSADLPAGTGGTPTSITGQTVWQISSGARSNVSGTKTVYNDTGADVPSGSQVLLATNPDNTYTVISVACTANT